MSFNWHARKVRDPRRSIAIQRSALGSCILSLRWLTGKRIPASLGRFAPLVGKGPNHPVTEQQLKDAVAVLERQRNHFLECLRAFERKRLRDKFRGKRVPSKADWQLLWPETSQGAGEDAVSRPKPEQTHKRTGDEL
jgi:hypothetical protein